jgi:hypothetical protein
MAGQAGEGRFGRGGLWRLLTWGGAGLALLAPLVAMQVTDAVAWSGFDFAFAAALLGGAGLGVELAVRRSGLAAYRIGAVVALAAGLLLVWINGAVGIIGSEREAANRLYLGVLAVALAGAAAARFRAAGMAWAMLGAAAAQVLVPLAAARWVGAMAWSPPVLGLTGGFAALWLVSAWQFRRAAAQGRGAEGRGRG